MKSVRSPNFRKLFKDLPQEIQSLAAEKYKLWKSNLRHPSLHFKPVGKYWSVSITREYRALCVCTEKHLFGFGLVPTVITTRLYRVV